MLRTEYAGQPITSQALSAACSDASDVVRLYAASARGREGRDVLRRLARSSREDSCAARAVAVLAAELESGEALEILRDALRAPRPGTAVACIEVLAGRGGEATAAFYDALAVDTPAVAGAAARALQHHPGPESQEALIGRGLGHRHGDVRLAAAATLGRIGTVDAVLPLTEIATRGGGDVRKAARAAVAAIQSRLQGAAPGQLSMPAAEGGAVTLASEGGEISLAGTDASVDRK
jgi:HEAT repeat protein